jgi:uncharacterized protein (DUF58 family)
MDPLDYTFPKTGLLELQDPETHISTPCFGISDSFRTSYTHFWTVHYKNWEDALKKRKIDTITINTGDDPVVKLLSFFRKRKS